MRRFITLCSLVVVFSFSRAYGSGFALYEASVRIAGMMGAYVANGNNASTIFYNPAGLAQLSGINVSFGSTFIAPRTTFRGPLPYSVSKSFLDKQTFFVPNFYATYQIRDGLTAGIGLYAPYGLGTRWPSNWVGRGEAINTEIQTLYLNPALAYRLPIDGINIMVGAGVTMVVTSQVKLSRAVTELVPEGTFSLKGDQNDMATGYNVGIMIQPNKMVSIGFTYRSKVKVEYSGIAQFNNLPASAFPAGIKGRTKINMPANLAVGVNVKPIKNLNVEADYVWYEWSSFKTLEINFDQQTALLTDLKIPRDYKNSSQVRVGGEYNNAFVNNLTLRAGISYDNSPIPNYTLDPTLPDNNRWSFSGGVSYKITNMLSVDAFYMFIRAKERTVMDNFDGFNGYYNTYANLYGIGFTINI
ncbi:MAG TPA: OmpP1/FadL family transporter [Balneolales bacterium]|nr:OmpP1/FadL family transporter [Balneolales bacterium]